MRLLGMLDSPYVRRAAIALHALGLPFQHEAVSVFRDFERFRGLNPVVKAPTFVCDDGTVLMDSTLIVDYAQALAGPGTRLLPEAPAERAKALRITGLALASCDKSVQLIYERQLRPAEKQHEPWMARVRSQILAAVGELELAVRRDPQRVQPVDATLAGISTAVAWYFIQAMIPEIVSAAGSPSLRELSRTAETLPAFSHYAHAGPGVPAQ